MAVSQTLTLTQTNQDVAGNCSYVRIRWTSTQSGDSWNGYTRTAYYYVSINGGTETRYSVSYTLPKSTTKTIVDKTITVSHRADGTGSVKVRTWMDTSISAGVVEKSKSLTLDTIPRATTPTLSASSADMGSIVTISLPRASSEFTHELAYIFGAEAESSYTNIATGVDTSYDWTVPDKATSIPAATSGQFTIRVQTIHDGVLIGTKYAYLNGTVPTSIVPTVSSLAHSEATPGLATQFDAYIQHHSKLAIVVTASGAKGSTIKSYQTTLQGKTYTDKSFVSDLLTSSGIITIMARVQDSRGRWSEYETIDVTILPYTKPVITRFRPRRGSAAGAEDDSGEYLIVDCSYSVASLSGHNTASMIVQYKRSTSTEDTWSEAIYSNTALTMDAAPVIQSPTFSADYQYDIRVVVEDWFGASTASIMVLPSGKVILDIKADGQGIAIGKTAELPGIEFGWDIVRQISAVAGILSGQYKTHDGLLLQFGIVSITPEAAGAPTTAVVRFPLPYAHVPITLTSVISTVPHIVSVSTQHDAAVVDDNTQAVALTITRNGAIATGIAWLAIGEAAE